MRMEAHLFAIDMRDVRAEIEVRSGGVWTKGRDVTEDWLDNMLKNGIK